VIPRLADGGLTLDMTERVNPPAGLWFVAVLAWIVGAAQVLSGVGLLFSDVEANVWLAALDFFVGGIAIMTGFTLLTGDRLGRVLAAVVFLVVLIGALLNVLSIGPGFSWGSSIAGAVLSVVGLVMLFSRRSNEFFA